MCTRNGTFIAIGAALLLIAGCASIVSGTKQDVTITSNPSAAQVSIDRAVGGAMQTEWEGATPATVELKRKHAYVLTLSLDGYQPVEMGLKNGTNGWVWGNLVFGGLIGLIVDFSNGAAKTLEPDEIYVDLVTVTAMESFRATETVYAVFHIANDDGDVRVSPVPLVPDPAYAQAE